MRVLGIESSCDETSAAVIDTDGTLLGHVIHSQQEHAAVRRGCPRTGFSSPHANCSADHPHGARGVGVQSTPKSTELAVTAGPGLVGSLLVGISVAKGMALAARKKLVGVHHLEGHIFSTQLENELEPPFLTLLVSGGHSEIIFVKNLGTV